MNCGNGSGAGEPCAAASVYRDRPEVKKLSQIGHLMQIWDNLHEMPCTGGREYATI